MKAACLERKGGRERIMNKREQEEERRQREKKKQRWEGEKEEEGGKNSRCSGCEPRPM